MTDEKENQQQQPSIMVPLDDMDTVSEKDQNTPDVLAMELATIQQMAKKIAKSIVKQKRRAVIGWDAKLMCLVAKVAPVKGLALIRWVMKTSKSKVFTNVFDYKN